MPGLILFLLAFAVFSDAVTCTVQGYVSRDTAADAVTFAREDLCPGVKQDADQHALLLHSPTHWVYVPISPEPGHRRFVYHWGAGVAHLHTETVPIQWGAISRS